MFGRREPVPVVRDGLVVGPRDRIQGEMTAHVVTVAGAFEGSLSVADQLTVVDGGQVTGAIDAARLVVAPGGRVHATCRIGVSEEEAAPFLPQPTEPEQPAVDDEPPARARRVRVRDDDGTDSTGGLGW